MEAADANQVERKRRRNKTRTNRSKKSLGKKRKRKTLAKRKKKQIKRTRRLKIKLKGGSDTKPELHLPIYKNDEVDVWDYIHNRNVVRIGKGIVVNIDKDAKIVTVNMQGTNVNIHLKKNAMPFIYIEKANGETWFSNK